MEEAEDVNYAAAHNRHQAGGSMTSGATLPHLFTGYAIKRVNLQVRESQHYLSTKMNRVEWITDFGKGFESRDELSHP